MRTPAIGQPGRRNIAQTTTLQAPVKGWTSDESLVEAEDGTAIVLDNFFPEADAVRLRRGSDQWATGVGSSVESLMPYIGGSTRKLFAVASSGTIYDVTSAGAASSSYSTSRTEGICSHIMFETSGGLFLVVCNGADAVLNYNGTAWSAPSITGVAGTDLIHVWSHQNRLWFIEKNTLNAWYLPTSAIAGAATKFPLGGLFRKGGKLIAGATWTVDSGEGMDDLCVFITDQGEVAVYAGTDPSSGTTWSIQGIYEMGKPISPRTLRKVGGDLLLLNKDGLIPLSTALRTDRAAASDKALTRRIKKAFADAVLAVGSTPAGWDMTVFPRGQMAIINVPATTADPVVQFVLNVTTGAWARWRGLEATCWAEFEDDIYFGKSDGKVWKAEVGGTDEGATVQGTMIPAFSALGSPGRNKYVAMVRPIVSKDTTGDRYAVGVAADYEIPSLSVSAPPAPGGAFFTWDVSDWDEAFWYGGQIDRDWATGAAIGFAVAPILVAEMTEDSGASPSWRVIGFDMDFTKGGPL